MSTSGSPLVILSRKHLESNLEGMYITPFIGAKALTASIRRHFLFGSRVILNVT